MTPLALAALAAGGAVVYHEATKGSAAAKALAETPAKSVGRSSLDPGMDPLVASAVNLAVKQESDPSVLTQFAAALTAAGFTNSAAALTARAGQIKA